VIGLQGGYNLQFSYNYLVGLEGDFSWGRDHSSVSFVGGDPALGAFSTNTITTTIDWTASLRGKLGYVIGPRLLYATAGVSFMNMNMAGNGGYGHSNIFGGGDFFTTVASSSNYSLTKTLVGPTVGVGIEEMLASKWLVRAEYLFADYGNVNFGNVLIGSTYSDNVTCHCTLVSTTAGTASARVMTQTFRLGLSLKLP
jgi:opacity protein-like surface antigen